MVGRVAAQRVLPGRRVGQDQINVRPGLPPRQQLPTGFAQLQGDDPVGGQLFGGHPDVDLELLGDHRHRRGVMLDDLHVRGVFGCRGHDESPFQGWGFTPG